MPVIDINSRSQEVYQLSTILRSPDSELWRLFREGMVLKQLSDEQSQFLSILEEWFIVEADADRVQEFNLLKEKKRFTNIDEITELIQKTLNRPDFTFNNIIWLSYEDTLISKIVEFYNVIATRIKKEDLATLFFSLCNSSKLREEHLSIRTFNANNHQCICYSCFFQIKQNALKNND